MHVNHATRLPRRFAFAALAAFVAALILPAIHERAYFDSQPGDIKEHTIHGFACAAGLCFSAWFIASHFFYLCTNITFVILIASSELGKSHVYTPELYIPGR
jgi:hypothetical protein